MLKLVKRHEPLVVDARQQRLKGRERLVQEAEGGVSIWLV